ncbi:MAG: CD36 family protein [Candidatus Heimdallarchaeota archaeon]|nr:CD36 family protein [Candidatus Heimdallarchaeota archaeon]
MVQTGKLAVISILAVLGLGALGGGFYVGDTYIPDLLDEGIKDSLVVDENFATDDPDDYADWLTNEDDDDPPKYKRYYLWNLTNPDEYLTGTTPIYEELGPYTYRQYDIKINVELTSTTKKYQTYTYYVYDTAESFDGALETDKIVNVNPAYLGVLGEAGSEAALVTGFVGPTISGLLEGMQGEFTANVRVQGAAGGVDQVMDGLTTTFPEKVLVGAIPTALLTVQAGVTENFHKVVNATTAANVMAANHGVAKTVLVGDTTATNAAFFNSTTFFATYNADVTASLLAPPIQGVGDVVTANLGYSNATITKLLFTGPDTIPVPGWFGDLSTGTGVLGFLQLYHNATNELGGLTNATLQAAYGGATQLQLDAAANYLANYLIASNLAIEGAYQAGNAGQTTLEAAQGMFYAQWANATFVPGGADINGDGLTPDGFEVGLPLDSDIDPATAVALFNASIGLSMTNDLGIQAWFGALLGNTTLQGNLATAFPGLNATQFGMLYNWLGVTFKDGIAKAGLFDLLAPAGVAAGVMSDIGYLHWGSPAVTSGLSANDLDPTTGGWIEVWAYASHILSNASFALSITESKALMTGAYNLTDTVSTGTFMLLGAQSAGGNATALATLNFLFGTTLDASQVTVILGYLNYVFDTLVVPTFGLTTADDIAFLHWGAPTVTSGLSLLTLAPQLELPNVPEFWAWAETVAGSEANFTVAQSKALLTGDNSLLNSTTVGMILLGAAGLTTGDAATIGLFNALLGETFSAAEYTLLIGYIQYMMQVYVAGWVLAPVIAAGGGLIASKSVEEWLWAYEDPLLLFLKANGQVDDASWSFFPPHDNATDPAISPAHTFKTGADDINNVMEYVLWQGIPGLPDRDDDPVNGVWDHTELVEGTDATQFHPDVKDTEVLRAWVSELARTVDITYLEDTKVEGIDLLRFVLSEETLAVNPAFDQTVKGVANMSYSQGVPLFISKPHFLGADASARSVTGLAPVNADHETFIDVEPTTGAVMNAAKRLQISFQISAGNFLTSGIVDTHFMPVVWVEEGGAITPDLAEDFKDAIYTAQDYEQLAPVLGSGVGIVLILTSMFVAIRARKP